jgi:hypothetical protein
MKNIETKNFAKHKTKILENNGSAHADLRKRKLDNKSIRQKRK